MATPKQTAMELIERLPDQASWNDIMRELYVMQKVKTELPPVADGRAVPPEDEKRRLMDKKQPT